MPFRLNASTLPVCYTIRTLSSCCQQHHDVTGEGLEYSVYVLPVGLVILFYSEIQGMSSDVNILKAWAPFGH